MNRLVMGDDLHRLDLLLKKLFENWGVDANEQTLLLGITEKTENSKHYIHRTAELLHIHKGLRLLFPDNRELAYTWIRTPHRALGELSPLHLMITEQDAGFGKVVRYLDQALHH